MQPTDRSEIEISDEMQALQSAEEGLLHCLDWAAEAVEELSNTGKSNRVVVEDKTERFLKTIKDVEAKLAASIKKQEKSPFGGSDTAEKQRAVTAASAVSLLQQQLADALKKQQT